MVGTKEHLLNMTSRHWVYINPNAEGFEPPSRLVDEHNVINNRGRTFLGAYQKPIPYMHGTPILETQAYPFSILRFSRVLTESIREKSLALPGPDTLYPTEVERYRHITLLRPAQEY